MEIFANKKVAITIALVAIILSALYGFSKRPTENSGSDSQLDNTPSSGQHETPIVSDTSALDETYELGKCYYEAGEYSKAITELRKVQDSSFYYTDAQMLLVEAADGYRTEIITQADNALSHEGYQSAISIINQGLAVLPKDNALLEKLSEYETYMPVDLFGLETFSGEPTFKVGAMTDTFGNENNQVYLKMTNSGDKEFSYLLNGEYNTLSGTLLWSKKYKNDDRGWYCLMFYDGNRLLYTTSQCSSTSGPIEFSANISNVQILTIKIDCFSNSGPFEMGTTVTIQK